MKTNKLKQMKNFDQSTVESIYFKGILPSVRERSLFRAIEGMDDIREGLWIFGKCWRRGQ